MYSHHFLTTLFLLLLLLPTKANILYVSSQKQFDEAVERINAGEDINLVLKKGKYVLKANILAKSPLSIKGNNATIMSTDITFTNKQSIGKTDTHYIYKLNKALSLFPLFFNEQGVVLPVSESVLDSVRVNYVDGNIIAPNSYTSGTLIKIPIPNNLIHLSNKTFPCAFGYLDSGWGVVNFKIESSDSNSFYCTTINNCLTQNYQYDRTAYHKKIRFVLYNTEIKPEGIYFDNECLYVPTNISKFYVLNRADGQHEVTSITTYSDLQIQGINFVGFGRINVESKKDDKCVIRNCCFRNGLDYSIIINKRSGSNPCTAHLTNCNFYNCSLLSGNIIRMTSSFGGSTCIHVSKCSFIRYATPIIEYKNPTAAVFADGDVLLENNIVKNTCRDHFYLSRGRIIARGNILFNSDEFNGNVERNGSNDWGLIYCGSFSSEIRTVINNKEHQILIENNLLYGACSYAKDSRGIFMDSGRGDVTCRNNVIINTQDYSIDSRVIKKSDASSIRNRYEGNIITNHYRLQSGAAVVNDDMPIIKGNRVFSTNTRTISNVQLIEEDTNYRFNDISYSSDGDKIRVSKGLYKQIKKTPGWKVIKRYIRKQ